MIAGVVIGGAAVLVFLVQCVREFRAGMREGRQRFDAMIRQIEQEIAEEQASEA